MLVDASAEEGLEALLRGTKDVSKTRRRLWNRVRGPIAKSFQTFSGMAFSASKDRAALADVVASVCGFSWDQRFVAKAVEAIPEPRREGWSVHGETTPRGDGHGSRVTVTLYLMSHH